MSMNKLQDIRKRRAHLSAERCKLKEESQQLRIAERDAKNTLLADFLAQGNFEQTHGNVRRVKPRFWGGVNSDLREMLDTWREECRMYDEARARLIKQKIELLYKLQDRAEDLTNFLSINFKGNKS